MKKSVTFASGLLLAAGFAAGQPAIRLPETSPAASAAGTIGVTDVEVRYHRPAVNKRKIWDGLVPYGVVWRAGANENTTISFSTRVTVEGKPVAAGTYGLFMIPAAGRWTVILSKFAAGWGAYSYEPSEDEARLEVAPQPLSEPQERLLYTFDDLAADGATLSLRWEKLRVPLRIHVDLPSTVAASIREELRGGKHWNSEAWAAAARWELRNGDTRTALEDADHALSLGTTFGALRTKAAILDKTGDAKGAAALRERANAVASEAETIIVAVTTFDAEKKYDEAIAWLTDYAAKHPDSRELWRVHAQLGDTYFAKKDLARARAEWDKAMSLAHDVAERTEVQDSINAAGAEE